MTVQMSPSWINLHIKGEMTDSNFSKTLANWPIMTQCHNPTKKHREKRKQWTNLQASSTSTLFKDKDSNSCSGIYNGWGDTAKCKHPPIEVAVPLIKQEICKEDRGTGMSSNSCEMVVKELKP